jgi:chromosome partitioning protein
MKTWAVAAQKGGVGKTTTTVSLAGALLAQGARVLVVDLDPHSSLTTYFGFDPDDLVASIYDLFEAAVANQEPVLTPLSLACVARGLSLVPSSPTLVTLERRHGQRQGMGLVLKRALARVHTAYDYCLIDCPPTLGVLVVNALVAADQLIVPVQTDPMSAQALDRMLVTVSMLSRSRGAPLPYIAVPTMFDRRTRAAIETLNGLRARRDLVLWDDVIPVDTQLREASRCHQLLPLWQPQARASQAYTRLTERLLAGRAAPNLRAVG